MEENTPINADIVNVPTNGASAGMTESIEPKSELTQRSLTNTDTSKPKRSFFNYVKIGLRAYAASLIEILVAVPIVASVVTLGLYFSTPISAAPNWYPVVFGMLYTYIAWLVIALPISYLATVQTSNPRSYGLLITRLRQLEARLKEIDVQRQDEKPGQMATYQLVALREAHNNFEDLENVLYNYPSGLQWVLYIGYINAWGKLHRAEEALIEVEPVEMVIRGAMHDKLALQDSNLSSRDELLRKMRQAVFYIVGAVFGLAGRIYRESQISTAVDDYGLSLARLFATPLLSGLAGIGGVFLFSTLLVEPNSNSITNIFAVNRPDFVIAAAFFGLTPNLLIRGLQQRAEKYMSALKSSKGAVEETFDNGN